MDMFRSWWSVWWTVPQTLFLEPVPIPAWVILAFSLASIALGILIVIWPAILSLIVASWLIAFGAVLLPGALAATWRAWRHRPRRIPVRAVRA
jgi:hypothetical protein